MAARYEFNDVKFIDQPKSGLQQMIENMGEDMAQDEKRRGFKVVKSDDSK